MNIPNAGSTILNFILPWRCDLRFPAFVIVAVLFASCSLFSQTVGTGSISGIVVDPQGTALSGAKVEIRNKATAAGIHVSTSSDGFYSSGPIQPGEYVVRVKAATFMAAELPLVVRVGSTSNGNMKLQVGEGNRTVPLEGTKAVNIVQPTVQGVLSGEQAEKLPINGRNYFDLAQLEPGVQVQDGGVLDASKNGLSSPSVLSQYGRATRIELDGVDISDEMMGSTTQNIPSSAIQEFQVAQSLLDLSTGLTSSGAVNVITRSGSNQIRGELFGVFRGDQGAAALPGSSSSSFQREQFGGRAGGAIIRDKVFWFADAERSKQDLTAAQPFTAPFDRLNAALVEPYREFDTDERLDWNMRGSTRAFYRFNFFQNSDLRPYGAASSTQQFRNTNNTATNALGVDFNTGLYSHSFRFEYLKLRSAVSDATGQLSGIDNPIPGLGINLGATTEGNCALSDGGSYCAGPSWLAPQRTIQSDKLARYDGSRIMGSHLIRYGAAFNRIDGARMAAFATFPQVGTASIGDSTLSDPTLYPADYVSLGNGRGFSTTKTGFGFPGGGLGPDNRLEMYVGDAWRVRPRVTLTYGLHYVHDSGVTDSNLGPLPTLNQWGSGYGNRVDNPNLNLAPQFGFAWDVGGAGKTVVRGGAGLFFGNSLWNNLLHDSPPRLKQGTFLATPEVCSGGVPAPFVWPTSFGPGSVGSTIAGGAATVTSATQVTPNFCAIEPSGGIPNALPTTIAQAAPRIFALSSAYQAATAAASQQPNIAYLGSALSALNNSGYDLFYPGYRTPRSWQMNLGFEKEFHPGTVFSVDYVRNVGEHFLIAQDINHSGAARSFNQANAVAARDRAQTANGCPAGFGQATCMIGKLGVGGAQAAYSVAGLDSNVQTTGGAPCNYCAFPGTNPVSGNQGTVGGVDMLFPDGRSLYSGFQAKLVQRIDKPIKQLKAASFQISYSYSKFISQVQDQDFVNLATDNDNPTRFTGPNGLDRKHQISFGGNFELPYYTKISLIGHFYSPLAQNLQLPELTNGGEIFATDWLGAGLGAGGASEPVPGTQIGQFQRGTDINSLQSVLNAYNHSYANTLTPAGACLVANDIPATNHFSCPGQISGPAVMTPTDMVALGWVLPTIDSVPAHGIGIPWLKSMDFKASWPIKIKDRVTIEPSASVFNVFNFWNAFLPGNLPAASLLPGQNGLLAAGAVGGATQGSSLAPFRANFQSGTYALGTPRQFEFGLRIIF